MKTTNVFRTLEKIATLYEGLPETGRAMARAYIAGALTDAPAPTTPAPDPRQAALPGFVPGALHDELALQATTEAGFDQRQDWPVAPNAGGVDAPPLEYSKWADPGPDPEPLP